MYKLLWGINDIQISLSYLNRQHIDFTPLKICFNVYYNNEFKCCYQSCFYGIVVLPLPSKYEIKTIKTNEKTFLAYV